ncbi:hypothetical protein [Actinomarinicola tropica]|uniref:ParD-like antitoxin of type II toxin-antitoxin system n=1 Tax=Actinomarinicola tropica TaxID=2789776 RepID=A0A5Q2RH31_9ACTN|nr:hypothetical protein [Actinomarinicola tropica]QGG94944.1 hypothetical protein GH723_07380 [Actinomarinicola tropica]
MEPTELIPMGSGLLRQAQSAAHSDRTPAEQLNYWARLGMNVDREVANLPHVLAAVTGRRQFADLDHGERALAHAVIDAQIAAGVAQSQFG